MNKIVLVVVLLAGSINWMAYRAFLTSELSVSKVAYPFNNFETLLKTDFRYYNRHFRSRDHFITSGCSCFLVILVLGPMLWEQPLQTYF